MTPDDGFGPQHLVVHRHRLVQRVLALPPASTVLITAGAGSGKSTVLEQFARKLPRPVVRLVLNSESNDRRRLGLQVLDSIAAAGLQREVAPVRTSAEQGDPDWHNMVLPSIVETLADSGAALVVDDAHRVTFAPAMEALRSLVIDWPSPGLVIVASRQRMSGVTRPRARGGAIHFLDAADLALDSDEIEQIASAQGLQVATLSQALAHTGGWPAGVRILAATAGATTAWSSSAEQTLDVESYIRREVVEAMEPHEALLLAQVAVLCPAEEHTLEAVLLHNRLLDELRELVRRGVPMLSVEAGTVSVHALLRDALVSVAEATEPGVIAATRAAGARHFERAGRVLRSIALLLESGERAEAMKVLYRRSGDLVVQGRIPKLRAALDLFTDDERRSEPLLWVPEAHAARPRKEAAVRALLAPLDASEEVFPGGITADLARKRLLATFGFEAPPAGDEPRGLPRVTRHLTLAWIAYASGDIDESRRLLDEVETLSEQFGFLHAMVRTKQALLVVDDDPRRASHLVDSAFATLTAQCRDEAVETFLVDAAAARCALEEGDLELADAHARACRRKMTLIGEATYLEFITALVLLAEVAVRQGQPSEARAAVQQSRALLRRYPEAAHLRQMLARVERRLAVLPAPDRSQPEQLSPAELRVLHFLPSHYSLPRIARELTVAPSTVRSQVLSIYRKMGVSSREEAVAKARLLNLNGAPQPRLHQESAASVR